MVEITFAFSGPNDDIVHLTQTEVKSVLLGYEILPCSDRTCFFCVCVIWFYSVQWGFFLKVFSTFSQSSFKDKTVCVSKFVTIVYMFRKVFTFE